MNTTQWGLILTAAHDSSPDAAHALNELCKLYWYPVYALVRRQGRSPEDAQDLTQEFFSRLLDKGYLRRADANRGRFRTFLLTCLRHFIINEWTKGRALKRGGGQLTSLVFIENGEERYRDEPVDDLSPDKVYERRWAEALLDDVLERLALENKQGPKRELFDRLRPWIFSDGPEGGYQTLADELGMTEGGLRVAAHRLRERYRQLLREAVGRTVAKPEETEDELRYLSGVLRS